MGTVRVEKELDVPAAAVWKVLSDFAGFLEWTGGAEGRSIRITGDGIGMVRHLVLPGIGEMAERLDVLDHATRTQAYTLVSGTPIGMRTYTGKVVVSDTPTGCRLNWTGEFTVAPDADADMVAKALEGSYAGMSQALGVAAAF